MTFPINSPIPTITLSDTTPKSAVRSVHIILKALATRATTLKTLSAAGDTSRTSYPSFSKELADSIDNLTLLRDITGFSAAADVEYPALAGTNWITEINARIQTVAAMRTWVVDNFPKNAGGFGLEWQFDANGRPVSGTFTVVQTATFRSAVDTFLNGLS